MKPRDSMPTTRSTRDVVEAGRRDRRSARPNAGGVAEQRRDVAERDAGLWVVDDVADVLAEPRLAFGCHVTAGYRCQACQLVIDGYRQVSAALLLARARRVRQQPVGPARPSAGAIAAASTSSAPSRPRRAGLDGADAPGRRPAIPPTTRSRSVSPRARSAPFVASSSGRVCLKIAEQRGGDEDRRVGAGDHADQQRDGELAERHLRRGARRR